MIQNNQPRNPALPARKRESPQGKNRSHRNDEYYRRYGTQANQDGWVRVFLPEEQRTIYVKN